MTSSFQLSYLFDPLCGWCYAAAPALKRLAERHGDRLTMMPTGLFVAPRPVAAIADHASTNDLRIARLTGQPFSDAYHQGVMRAPNGVFTSQALTRGLVALGQISPALEPRFLHDAQIARYVDGQDTSRAEVVAGIAVQVARRSGVNLDESAVLARLEDDPALREATEKRISAAREMMDALRIQGIPQLVVTDADGARIVDGQTLYAGGDSVLAALGEPA